MDHKTLTTPVLGWLVLHRLRLAMVNPHTYFKVSISISYKHIKDDTIM